MGPRNLRKFSFMAKLMETHWLEYSAVKGIILCLFCVSSACGFFGSSKFLNIFSRKDLP